MYLTQIRYGFATNSSSSHSVILADSPQWDSDVPDDFSYQWDTFVLASEQAKRDYFFVQCKDNFYGKPDWDEFIYLVRPSPELLTPEQTWRGEMELPGSIDHESVGLVHASTIEEVKELLEWLDNPRITILGGNDNTEYDFGIPGVEFEPRELSLMTTRKEARGIVLFNKSNGTKIHLFDEPIDFDTYIASAPELVDIKLTDWCDLACKFCYQDSTKKGLHAPLAAVKAIIDDLFKAGVFEVALGGGEPMAHPNFREILEYCRSKGIVPNFTTRNYKALTTQDFEQYSDLCGSVGVSIATPDDVAELMKYDDLILAEKRKLSLQVAMGAQSPGDFASMLALLEETKSFKGMIMLGYKDTGRGHRAKGNRWYEPDRVDGDDPIRMYKTFLERRREANRYGYSMPLSMDTEMVRATESLLLKHGVRAELYMKNEGRVSCYIDAVAMRIAPSSYCDESWYRDYNLNVMDIWPEMSEEYYERTKQIGG